VKDEHDIEKQLKKAKPEYLMCRDLRHPWQPYDAHRDGKRRTITRTLVCPRCGTLRHDVLDFSGYVVSQRYEYPEGYQLKGGSMTAGDRAMMRIMTTLPNFSKGAVGNERSHYSLQGRPR